MLHFMFDGMSQNCSIKFFIRTAREIPNNFRISIIGLGIIEIIYTDKDGERKFNFFFFKFKN